MSWPSDGEPRFIVVEVSGTLTSETGHRRSDARRNHVTCTVLDRAVAHRNVRSWRSEDHTRPLGVNHAVAAVRRKAAEHCDALNRGDGETVCEVVEYLGFRLTVTENYITVDAPDGKRLGLVRSMTRARLLIREYRRAMRAAA